jgi:hypothetical protein
MDIDRPSARIHIVNCPIELLTHNVVQSLDPVCCLLDYGSPADWAAVCTLEPIVYAPTVERVCAVQSILGSPNSLETDGTFWKLVIWAVMNTELMVSRFHTAAWVDTDHL